MNARLVAIFTGPALAGLVLLALLDAAAKGAVILLVAAVAALVMRRASAASRHHVWLCALGCALVLPIASWMLPQWHVLPGWMRWEELPKRLMVAPARQTESASMVVERTTANPRPLIVDESSAALLPSAPSDPVTAHRESRVPDKPFRLDARWLLGVWAVGSAILLLPLALSAFALGRKCRRTQIVNDGALAEAAARAQRDLGFRQRVRVLLGERNAMPMVWGVFRPCLLLPADAVEWTPQRLRAVLLHELAHLRRRDPLWQLVAHCGLALHWFNPLAWFAVRRLRIEQERACDDFVLRAGIRASEYATDMLAIVGSLRPAPFSAAALTMANLARLEGRITGILDGARNRRALTGWIAAAAVLIATAIALPLAMLRAADEKKSESANASAQPNDKEAQALFKKWTESARGDGKIPGGRIGEMAASLKTYMDLNAGTEAATKCEATFKKCDAARDWTPAEAAALLDEIEVVAPSRAEWAMRTNTERTIHSGKPLPDELANAPWGQPAANGLRIAWLLEPRAETQALDSVMKSRVLFHNTGKAPVCFATEDWIQVGGHKAKDANGKDISVQGFERMGIRTRMIFRLAPGEYAEVEGHGLGVGSHETSSEKSIYKVGCWIEAKEGDAVTFTPGSVPVSFQTWINNEGRKDSVTVWKEMIAARVAQESPMPAAAKDREQLLRRVMQDFPGTAPTAGEMAAFIADNAPDALTKLAARLETRSATMHFAGELSGGETKFRVTAARAKEEQKQDGAPGAGATPDDITKGTAARSGETLPRGTEAQLDWGEAVNGLRGAVVVRAPKAGAAPGVYLAVQNVSASAMRFSDTIAAEKIRTLYVSAPTGRILFALTNGEPTKTDTVLQPREVAFLRMMPPEKTANEKSPEAALIEGLRKDSLQTWKVVLEIEKAPEGAWKGKLTTAETRGATGTEGPQPENKKARALFKLWQDSARLNGDIPGGLLSRLHDKVKEFIRNNTGDASGDPYAKKMAPLEKRFGNAGDWKPADVVTLFDDIAAVTDIPLEVTMEHIGRNTLQHGQQLPAALQKADWGEPLPGGLRMAYVLEPRAEAYHLGTEVKARIILHNSGNEPVAFVTSGFQQPGHSATSGNGGAKFTIDSTFWTTLGRPEAYRLAPGEYCEVYTPGLGIGARNKDHDDWSNVRAGSWILCGEVDDVVFTPGAVMLTSNETPADPGWWLEFITERLMRETPVPQDMKEREYLLYRVMRDLFGTAPSTTQGDAFAADKSPDALKNLAVLLTKNPYGKQCGGPIRAGETKFRVIAPDPDAAKKPRVAKNPGRYNIGDIVRLVVTRSAAGERIVNDGSVTYYPPGKDNITHDLKLPDGYDTWAAAWGPGTTVLWVTQKGLLRKVDFTDPTKVEETRFEGDRIAEAPIPRELREALRAALDVPDAPAQQYVPLNPAPAAPAPATPKPAKEGADAKLQRTHLWNDKHAAIAVQSGNEVKFVLVHRGFLSSGMSEWSYGNSGWNFQGWGFQGHVNLVDVEKSRAAGKNVDLRSIEVKYTSEAPDTLFLDGQAHDLTPGEKPGRVFILREKGEPLRSDRTLELRDTKDLVKLGELADATLQKAESAAKTDPATAGKLRSASRTGDYDLGGGRKLYICRPNEQRQWFSILWPESERWPKCLLRIEPNLAKHADVKWAVVWEPAANVLWWADETDVAKVRLTDPANVLVDREGRENNFSRDFGLSDEVKEEFRKLGFVIGRDKTPGRETLIGGNTRGQTVLSAQAFSEWSVEGAATDADGKPIADVPVTVRTEYRPTVEIATANTDARGRYHVAFRLDLETLARFRGVTVWPRLAGFTERELARGGEFHALLFASEQPQRVPQPNRRIDEDFKPGPIPRFGEHDLVATQPGRADFVMLPAGEIVGRVVTTEGAPLPNYFISLAAPQQRAGYSVASASSDERGQFHLASIPTNQALVFTTNPGGKPGETVKAAPEKFETAKIHHVRVIAPPANSGAPLKVERTEDELNPPAAAASSPRREPGSVVATRRGVGEAAVVEPRLELERAEATLARLAKLRSENSVSSQEVDEATMKVEVLKAEIAGDKTGAARARLAHAETELKRATELSSQKLISQQEVDEMRMRVEVLKAELVGDKAAAARARLAHAETELKRATELLSQRLISQQEIDELRMRVEVLKAEMMGDETAAARARLAYAETELKRVIEAHSQKLISSQELDQARAAVEVRKAELAGDRLAVARAQLAQAEAQLKRVVALREQKLVAEADYESAKMAVEVARAAIEAAKSQPQPKPGKSLVVVEIHADGTIHIGAKTLSLTELEKHLAELRREDPALAVTLAAAKAVDYTSVTAVLNVLKTAGISNATLQAGPSAADNAPTPRQKWTATGRVTDKDGEPMEGVLISVDAGMGSLFQTGKAATGADGRYTVEFTQGVMMEKDSPGLQFANITARKPHFFEKNLNRHGAGAMALREVAADDLNGYGVAADSLALPSGARTVDFVMLPAARIKGRLLGTGNFSRLTPEQMRNQRPDEEKLIAGYVKLDHAPLAGWQLWLKGNALPPGASVICTTRTDKDGNFVMEEVPTGFEWQFLGETNRSNVREVLSRQFFKLRNAVDYSISLELPEKQDNFEINVTADGISKSGNTVELSNPE